MVLNVRNLSKRFDMTQALEDVSMDMKAGEIHALVGENGAGKSTLIKILTGIQHADQGEVLLQGQTVRISDAQEAQSLGIAAIFFAFRAVQQPPLPAVTPLVPKRQ